MQVFRIKIFSLLIYSISWSFIILVGMVIGVYFVVTKVSDVYFFILILFGLAALVFIPDVLSTASTEWWVTDEEIKLKWLRQFLFSKRSDVNFSLENIKEYTFQPQKQFSLLRVKLRDNNVYKFWHGNATIDDFDAFLTNFQKKIIDYNEEGINILHGIKRGKTVYETTYGLVVAIITAILMLGYLILVAEFNFKPRYVTWVYIIPAYSGGIYFISQVVAHRKKKKQQPT